MNVQRLIESINRYETIHGFKPHGVTMLASDAADLQADLAKYITHITSKSDAGRVPKCGEGETYVMTFLGVPIFTRTSGMEPDRLSLWVSAKQEPRAVQSLKAQIRKRR